MKGGRIVFIIYLMVNMALLYVNAWGESSIRFRFNQPPGAQSSSSEGSSGSWPDCYSRLDDLYSWVQEYARLHPDFLEVYDIGDSYCKQQNRCRTPGGDIIAGRDLFVVRVTNENTDLPKEGRLFIDSGLHARELLTTEVVKAFIRRLVEGYGKDAQITYLLDRRELYAAVSSNPDGRLLVEMGAQSPYNGKPWSWRKNANETKSECLWQPQDGVTYGVDLNRNHSFKWGGEGSSDDPCSSTYRGSHPASEPEIQAYEEYVRSLFPDQRGPEDDDAAPLDATGMLINLHSFTRKDQGTVLVPWGWTSTLAPNNAGLFAIAKRYASFPIYAVKHALYPVSGTTRDWGYGELGIPSLVVELPGSSFIAPCNELSDVVSLNMAPLVAMLGLSDRPYTRIRGPRVTWVKTSNPGGAGGTVAVTARFDDRRSGNDAVAGAEFKIGRVGEADPGPLPYPGPGVPAGKGRAMTAEDGRFDEPTENGVFEIDTASLPPGRYYIVVRGEDEKGYWGSASAIFFEVASSS